MRILIAADDLFFRKLLQQFLAPGFEIIIAEDGVSAWEVLRNSDDCTIAILDWVMPGLPGPEICRRVRAKTEHHDQYLILLTARESTEDIATRLRCGADDYISKPFQPEELLARVRLAIRIVELQKSLEVHRKVLREANLEKTLESRLNSQELNKLPQNLESRAFDVEINI